MVKDFFGKIIPYLMLALCFCADLWLFFIVGKQLFFFTLSYVYAYLFLRPFSFTFCAISALLLASISLTISQPFASLIISYAAMPIILALKPHLYPHSYYPSFAISMVLAVQMLSLSLGSAPATLLSGYTISAIFGTLIVSMLFSLTLKTGKKGQSLTSFRV